MSYRRVAAQYVLAGTKTRRYVFTLANGHSGTICASGDRDAQQEAARLAKLYKSDLVLIARAA